MADKPGAEVAIDRALVERLLSRHAGGVPGALSAVPEHVEDGWDCSIWRLGSGLAVRLPRRALAAPLVEHEQLFLPRLSALLTGIGVPAPVFAGRPDEHFPWPWSIVPWFEGEPALRVPRAARRSWAPLLGGAVAALHTAADGDAPANAFRGVPLAARDERTRRTFALLGQTVSADERRELERAWAHGLAAPPWRSAPVWVHGDLHPGNLIARDGRLVAIIDFGDLTSGDPACDLAVAWLLFDARGRADFRAAVGADEATWARARAWAAAVTATLLAHSDDNPAYLALGREGLSELVG